MIKFIRRNGRIIPIRDNRTPGEAAKKKAKDSYNYAQSEHGKMAIAGAAQGHLTARFLKFRGTQFRVPLGDRVMNVNVKTMPKRAGALSAIIGGGALGYSLFNSYKHGQERKSFAHGVGRALTNYFAFKGGSIGGSVMTKRAQKVISLVKGNPTKFSGKTFDAEVVKKGPKQFRGIPYKG